MRHLLNKLSLLVVASFLIFSCNQERDPIRIIQQTIQSIDTIHTISYDQLQLVGNTANSDQVKRKERKFFYERLRTDSIIGAKAHIYFFDDSAVFLEDIYDGNRLIRKMNRDSAARIFDLLKYPVLKKKPFWGKTTPWVIQYMIGYAIENQDHYLFELGADTLINNRLCYRLKTVLVKKALMPGFHTFENDTNRMETMHLFIDKLNFYPQRIRMEVYFIDQPAKVYFTDNTFYNIQFNMNLNDSLFNTSDELLQGFKIEEMMP